MSRPLIGITTQTLQSIDGIPEGVPASVVMNQRYYYAAATAGAAPVLISLLDDLDALRAVYERLDGLLIPGGVDVDPARYGETPHEKLGRTDADRDRVELQLTRWAVEDGKPFLGLCRGLHVMNVACGGTLFQDLEAQRQGSIKHDYFPNYGFERSYRAHDVELAAGSRLRDVLAEDSVAVNSMHHQGINALGRGLRASALAPDGVVEAAEGDGGGFMVAVQWHPEVFDPAEPQTQRLFAAFLEAASRS